MTPDANKTLRAAASLCQRRRLPYCRMLSLPTLLGTHRGVVSFRLEVSNRTSAIMIPTKIHGTIDYLYGLLLLVVPFALGFADGGAAQGVMMAFGAGAILYSLLTAYELGAIKLIPMPVHLALDVGAGIVLVASPWLFGFADRTWWPYVLTGGVSILVPLLTRRHPPKPSHDSRW